MMRNSLLILLILCCGVFSSARKGISHLRATQKNAVDRNGPSASFVIARLNQFRPLDPSNQFSTKSTSPNYEERSINDFRTLDSRLGFMRKVFSIFGSQILMTIGVTYYLMTHPTASIYLASHFDIVGVISFLSSLLSSGTLVYSPHLRHTPPYSYLLLAIYTLSQSVVVGTFASLVDPRLVLLSTMHSLTVLAVSLAYTLIPHPPLLPQSLTPTPSFLLLMLTSLVTGSILTSVFHVPISQNVFSALLALVFIAYIIRDLKDIVGASDGRKATRQYSSREYILASLSLYQDIMGFFIQILKILVLTQRKQRRGKGRED